MRGSTRAGAGPRMPPPARASADRSSFRKPRSRGLIHIKSDVLCAGSLGMPHRSRAFRGPSSGNPRVHDRFATRILRGTTGEPTMSRPHYRILHVDDSADDAELVRLALEGAPFACSVSRVETEADYV